MTHTMLSAMKCDMFVALMPCQLTNLKKQNQRQKIGVTKMPF
jgi:hypothetical protein